MVPDHIILKVNDIDASVGFYTNVPGWFDDMFRRIREAGIVGHSAGGQASVQRLTATRLSLS